MYLVICLSVMMICRRWRRRSSASRRKRRDGGAWKSCGTARTATGSRWRSASARSTRRSGIAARPSCGRTRSVTTGTPLPGSRRRSASAERVAHSAEHQCTPCRRSADTAGRRHRGPRREHGKVVPPAFCDAFGLWFRSFEQDRFRENDCRGLVRAEDSCFRLAGGDGK